MSMQQSLTCECLFAEDEDGQSSDEGEWGVDDHRDRVNCHNPQSQLGTRLTRDRPSARQVWLTRQSPQVEDCDVESEGCGCCCEGEHVLLARLEDNLYG